MTNHRRALVAAALFFVQGSGCSEPAASCDDPVACTCGPARARGDGEACCPAWTVAAPDGRCEPRAFVLPTPGQTLGGPAARRLAIAQDGDGRALLVWDEAPMPGLDQVVVAEETSPLVFTTHVPSAKLSGPASLPVLSATDRGDVVVAWRQSTPNDGGDIHIAERSPEGAWTDPASAADRVSFGERAYEPRLASRPAGETILVWNQWYAGEHYGVAVASRPSPDAPWVFPKGEDDVLSPPSFFSNAPQIAVNARGDAVSCWYQSPGGTLAVFKSERFGPDGAFSRPNLDDFLSPEGGDIDSDAVANPKPAVARDGRAAVVWTQQNAATLDVAVYLATRDLDGTWTRPAGIEDTFSPKAGKCRNARAAFDDLGGLYVVWSQDEGAGSAIYLAQRSFDGTWIHRGETPLLVSSPGAEAIDPVLAAGRDGHVIVAWSERAETYFQVAALRGSAAGFGAVEVLSPPNDHALSPAVAVGGVRDRGIVAWLVGEPSSARVVVAAID